jgi:hypothetical protein
MGSSQFMENYGGEEELQKNQVIEQGGLSSSEEAFMHGYMDDEDIPECSECGGALDDEKTVVKKEIDGENLSFCSKTCVEDFEESI